MSFKRNILEKYISGEKVFYIISHHFWRYKNVIILYVFLLGILFAIYSGLNSFINRESQNLINILFAGLGLLIYIKFIVDYLDIFLDSLVITDKGVTIFRWDGFFQQQSEFIGRDYIQTVYDNQSGIMDAILSKGDINIKIHEWEYVFEDVTNPTQKSNILSQTKAKVNALNQDENEEENDRFEILVETLGEVIRDYLKKSKQKTSEEDEENDEEDIN